MAKLNISFSFSEYLKTCDLEPSQIASFWCELKIVVNFIPYKFILIHKFYFRSHM